MMVRRILTASLLLAGLLVFATGPAKADRLGGAYRGPYQDVVVPKNEETTEVGATGGDTSAPGSDTGGGDTGGGGDSAAPPPDSGGGEDPGGGDTGGGGDEPPPTAGDEGGSDTGGTTTAPDASAGGGASSGIGSLGGGPGGKAKVAIKDVRAYWPFYFEHNKEWILGALLRARSGKTPVPIHSSARWFRLEGQQNSRTPLTEDDRKKVILPLIVDALGKRSTWVRDSAVLALGKIGGPEVIPYIVDRIRNDPDDDIVEDALLALGLTGEKDALPYLLANLQRAGSRKVFAAFGIGLLGRDLAQEALKPLFDEYEAALRRRDREQDAACLAIAIGMLGDESVADQLAVPLRNPKGNNILKVYVCQALGRLGGDKSEKWLLRALKDKDKGVHGAAVLALGNFPDRMVARHLQSKDGLESGDRMTKIFSVVALGRIGAALSASDPTRKAIRLDLLDSAEKPRKDEYLSMYAALALGLMGEDGASDFFEENLREKNRTKFSKEIHSAMAMSLALLDKQSAAKDLREIATRGRVEDDYRGYSAFALGILGYFSAKQDLKDEFWSDKRNELLRSGCWALGLMGDKDDIDWLLKCLTMEGQDKHFVRGAAALGIGLIGDRAAVGKLVKIVKDDPDSTNVAFAIAALGCLADRSPVPRMAEIFRNIHYRVEIPLLTDVMMNL